MFTILLNAIPVECQAPQEAVFWLPLLAIGAAVLAVTVIVIITAEDSETEKLKGKTLAILGMPEAGKTQFLRNLQGKKYEKCESTNGAVNYEDFYYAHGERRIKIAPGKDIGGAEENIKPYWKKMIEENEIILFIFDISQYFSNDEYRKNTNARLDFINKKIGDKKEWAIIGSHVDKAKGEVKKEEKDNTGALTLMRKYTEGKEYQRLIEKNFFARNLTDSKHFHIIISKLFGDK